MHSEYPHISGYLYDCEACEQQCHCDDGSCVYHAPDNPYRTESDRIHWGD